MFVSLSQGDAVKCYEAQSALHAAFNHVFGSSAGNWLVPALHNICRNTHALAVAADQLNGSGRNDHSKLQGAVTLLQESFSKTLNDRTEYQVSRSRIVMLLCCLCKTILPTSSFVFFRAFVDTISISAARRPVKRGRFQKGWGSLYREPIVFHVLSSQHTSTLQESP